MNVAAGGGVPILALADRDVDAFAAALGEAFECDGFAIVADHGIPRQTIMRAEAAMRALFALPEAEKRRWHVPGGGGARGYTPFGIEAAKDAGGRADLKEFWHVGREPAGGHALRSRRPVNLWPEAVPGFREAMLDLYAALEAAGTRLLGAIARYLDVPPAWLAGTVRDGDSLLRLLHYPPVPAGAAAMRAAPHEDIDVLTLLLGAEEAGLELLDRRGRWRAVSPPDGALVVNVGDMLQRLTGGRLRSATHRVVNPAGERAARSRYAMPFFLHFHPDFTIRPLPGSPDRSASPITAGDYLAERLREIGLL